MPFTFKLSKRLALLKASLAAAAVLAACERPLQIIDPTPPSSSVARVVVTPDTVILDPYQTRQFLAYGRTQAGDSVPVAVSWSASGGTITNGGLYTADTIAGTYQVTATTQVTSSAPAATPTGTTVSGSSQVRNRGPLAQVILTPATASLSFGGAAQFAAYGRKKSGDSVPVSVTYSATGGTISGAGLYTAGQTTGPYHVIARQSSGTLADTAAVAISDVPPVNPGTVTDLAVVGVTDTAATLAVTEVNDCTALPSSYDVRYQVGTITWGITATSVTRGTCATPLAGTAIGAKRTCTVLGLTPATAYQFQLVAFRGTLSLNAVFGGLSNITGATTTTSSSGSGAPQPGPTDTIVFQEGFESGNYNAWTLVPANDRYSIATDPTRVHSGKYSLQVLYTPTDMYGELVRWFMPGYDEIYVKFYVMFEENFGHGPHFVTICGSRIDASGSCFGQAGVVPNGTDYFYAGIDPDYVGDDSLRPVSFYTYWPDMSCCYGNRFLQTAPQTPLIRGQWQEVVYHIKLNTPGQYDGSQTLWVNGVKKIDVQNMRWRTTTDLRLNMIRLDNWTSYVTNTEHVWMDDITVWRP